jgi:GT2 family glycosyltransferase
LHQILWDIYDKCQPSISSILEVIVVDDCSDALDYHDGLEWWKGNGMLPIRHVRMNKNVGFLKASNTGLKKADGDVVCLISNDVRIYKDIVRGIFDKISGWPVPVLVGGRLLDWNTGWNEFDGKIFNYLEGWLLATTKYAWSELFYFDEQFVPHDFEDVSLSTKALSLGYELIELPSEMTHHLSGQSIGFSSEREDITKRNREIFKQLWIK